MFHRRHGVVEFLGRGGFEQPILEVVTVVHAANVRQQHLMHAVRMAGVTKRNSRLMVSPSVPVGAGNGVASRKMNTLGCLTPSMRAWGMARW